MVSKDLNEQFVSQYYPRRGETEVGFCPQAEVDWCTVVIK